MDLYTNDNEQIMNVLDSINITNQFTMEHCNILDVMIGEKLINIQDINEQQAILESSVHRDFYILLTRKLYCMINACENLSSGMVGTSNHNTGNTFRSFVGSLL
jgi:hypothetical protein